MDTTLTMAVDMAKVRRNLIPQLAKERGWSLPEFQREAGLSWSTAYKIFNVDIISDKIGIGTLEGAATAFGVDITDLYEVIDQ